jgi:hypothetical protein
MGAILKNHWANGRSILPAEEDCEEQLYVLARLAAHRSAAAADRV